MQASRFGGGDSRQPSKGWYFVGAYLAAVGGWTGLAMLREGQLQGLAIAVGCSYGLFLLIRSYRRRRVEDRVGIEGAALLHRLERRFDRARAELPAEFPVDPLDNARIVDRMSEHLHDPDAQARIEREFTQARERFLAWDAAVDEARGERKFSISQELVAEYERLGRELDEIEASVAGRVPDGRPEMPAATVAPEPASDPVAPGEHRRSVPALQPGIFGEETTRVLVEARAAKEAAGEELPPVLELDQPSPTNELAVPRSDEGVRDEQVWFQLRMLVAFVLASIVVFLVLADYLLKFFGLDGCLGLGCG
jgi:hypothetical protein